MQWHWIFIWATLWRRSDFIHRLKRHEHLNNSRYRKALLLKQELFGISSTDLSELESHNTVIFLLDSLHLNQQCYKFFINHGVQRKTDDVGKKHLPALSFGLHVEYPWPLSGCNRKVCWIQPINFSWPLKLGLPCTAYMRSKTKEQLKQ